eukprot:6211403-Pleurochrysis_carterae.AAC.1
MLAPRGPERRTVPQRLDARKRGEECLTQSTTKQAGAGVAPVRWCRAMGAKARTLMRRRHSSRRRWKHVGVSERGWVWLWVWRVCR